MPHLNRDHDLEQETGECSYCGMPLQWIQPYELLPGYFGPCPECDEYDQHGWLEDLAEWANSFDLDEGEFE